MNYVDDEVQAQQASPRSDTAWNTAFSINNVNTILFH